MKLIKLFLLRCICSKLKASCQQLINQIKMKFTELFLLTQRSWNCCTKLVSQRMQLAMCKTEFPVVTARWANRSNYFSFREARSPKWMNFRKISERHTVLFGENKSNWLFMIEFSAFLPQKYHFLWQFYFIFNARFVAICVFVWGKF